MNLDEARDEAAAWRDVGPFDETDNGDRAVLALLALAEYLDGFEARSQSEYHRGRIRRRTLYVRATEWITDPEETEQ